MSPLIGVIIVLLVVVAATICSAVSRSLKPRVRIAFLKAKMLVWWAAGKKDTHTYKKTEPEPGETVVVEVPI
jgi:hypothetical protein